MWQSFLRSFSEFLPFRTQPIRAVAHSLRPFVIEGHSLLSSRARSSVRVEGSAVQQPSNYPDDGRWSESAERSSKPWARPKGPCCPKCPSPNRPTRRARVQEWRYARSVIVQWLASLLADAKFLNDGFVALGIRLPEVIEQAATLAHHHEKAAPGGMVLLMRLEMLRQFTNPRTQDRDLNFRRAGVGRVSAVLVNQGGFFLSC